MTEQHDHSSRTLFYFLSIELQQLADEYTQRKERQEVVDLEMFDWID